MKAADGGGYLQGKTEFGRDSSKIWDIQVSDSVTGPWPSRLRAAQASPLLLMGAVEATKWGAEWDQEVYEFVLCNQQPGCWRALGSSFSSGHTQSEGRTLPLGLGSPNFEGDSDDSTLQNPQILSPNCQLPTPWVQSANPVSGAWGWKPQVSPPPRLCPGRRDPRALGPCRSGCGARCADAVQYWGPVLPFHEAQAAWDFMCWTLARIFFWCPAR